MLVAVSEAWHGSSSADAAELVDPMASARAAGLRYASDQSPGIRRKRVGKGFTDAASDGETMRDAETIRRVKRRAIFPRDPRTAVARKRFFHPAIAASVSDRLPRMKTQGDADPYT